MKHRIYVVTLVMGLLFGYSAALGGETLETVEKKIIAKWSKLKSMSAKMTMEMKGPAMSGKSDGTVEYLQQDGLELFRIEMKMEQAMGDQKREISASTICDGKFVYTTSDMMGQKYVMKQKPDAMQVSPGGKLMFESLKKNSELKLLPDKKVDGKAAFVIEASPKAAGGQPSKLFFAQDTGMMLKMVALDPEGNPAMTMSYTDVKLNPKLDPDRFVFKAPEGVQVMDMTGQ